MKEKMFLSMTDKERKLWISQLKSIMGFINAIKKYNEEEIENLDKINKKFEAMITILETADSH